MTFLLYFQSFTIERTGTRLVARFVTRFPLDVTTHTRFLLWIDRSPCQNCVNCSSQIAPIDRFVVAGAAPIQLSAINQSAIRIEQKEVGRTRGCVSFGCHLMLVVAKRKSKAQFLSHGPQLVGGIFAVPARIVGADGHNTYISVCIIQAEARNFLLSSVTFFL